jgi:hypothetical protein
MSPDDIVQEIQITRETPGATGHILFNAKVLMDNVEGITDRLGAAYAEPALSPASPWLGESPPSNPIVRITHDSTDGSAVLHMAPRGDDRVWQWVVQSRAKRGWQTSLLPGAERSHILNEDESTADFISVTAVDRTGTVSPPTVARRPR